MPIGHLPTPPPVHGYYGPGPGGHHDHGTAPHPPSNPYGAVGRLASMLNGMSHSAADWNIRFISGLNQYLAQERGPAQYGSAPGGWPSPSYPAPGGHVPPAAPHGYSHPPGVGGHGPVFHGGMPGHAPAHGVPQAPAGEAALDAVVQRMFELIDNRLATGLQAFEARLRALEARLPPGSAMPSADPRFERAEPPPLPRRPADRRGPALAGLDREPRPHPSDWDRRSMAADDLDEREHEHEEDPFSDAGSSSGRRRAPPPPPPPRRYAAPSAGMTPGLASGVDSSVADIAAGDASRAMLANVKSASQLEEDGRSHVLRHLLR
ncbi:hypothetical protein [Pigmentiphaga sp.]|uniref:hypothetical protein n=1 Tax=Pigmentiphaga sp. TaxID=1977564 RepID=UPI0025E54A98|nr:hypothetical protein [Pigmentiphaga sp.]